MSATLREFRDQDYGVVVRLWRDAGLTVKPSDTPPELRKLIDRNPGLFLVAEEGGSICGTVIGAWDGRRAWIYHLAVLPALQGRGIGRMLMEELERRLRTVGATKLNLLVERDNASVADFYRTLGYAPDELLFMTKGLTPDPAA
ncbi:MAG TPA: GNAT family N-acetyltransferase [Longimicrobium sp.]|nr:GNAT family N-acetyltransferase [Longimicrobium sp.]